jgi:hypothetical protein
LAVLAVLVLLWNLYRLAPWQAVRERPPLVADAVAWTSVNPIGVNTFLAREVEPWKRERTVEMVAESGAGWIKEHFAWSEIEPEDDVYWDSKYQQDSWGKYDKIVSLAEIHGLRVIARIDQTPAWAQPAGGTATTPPADLDAFGDFIETFVTRYAGRITFIQIWNEPNLAQEWGGRIDPEGYAALLAVAAERARAANPNVVILAAPMATTTENSERAMDELSYWQRLYDAGAASNFDIIAANAYGLGQPYDAEPALDTLNFRRVELLRELCVANGDAEKPIWLNEYGWNASPSDMPQDELIWARVSETDQANWTASGITYAGEHWPWFGVASVWYFRQVGEISPARSEYYFRMVDLEFTPRDVYWSVAALGQNLRTAEVGTFGDLEAPVRAHGRWAINRDEAASHGEYLAGQVGSSLVVAIDGSRLDLILAEGQAATRLAVSSGGREKIVAVSAGQSTVTVFSADGAARQQRREVEVTVVGDDPLLLDGIDVRYQRSWTDIGVPAFTALAGVGAWIGLGRLLRRD